MATLLKRALLALAATAALSTSVAAHEGSHRHASAGHHNLGPGYVEVCHRHGRGLHCHRFGTGRFASSRNGHRHQWQFQPHDLLIAERGPRFDERRGRSATQLNDRRIQRGPQIDDRRAGRGGRGGRGAGAGTAAPSRNLAVPNSHDDIDTRGSNR